MEKQRQANIEALRVVAMFLIVVMHYIFCGLKESPGHAYYDMTSLKGLVDYITMEPLYILSGTAVNCYVMVTGYFLIDRLTFRWKGILRTWLMTVFYSLVFLCAAFLLKLDVPKSAVLGSFFPVYHNSYWFVTSYIGLLLVAPLLSRAALSLSKKAYLWVLAVLFVLVFEFLYGKVFAGHRTLVFFSYLFLLGGYFRLHGIPQWFVRYRFWIFAGLLLALFILASGVNILRGNGFALISSAYDGPLLFLSLSIFVIALTTRGDGRLVSALSHLAPYTFGVYLIHANYFVNERIYALIPSSVPYPIILHCLLFSILLFTVCIMVDFLRERLFKLVKMDAGIDRLGKKMPQL